MNGHSFISTATARIWRHNLCAVYMSLGALMVASLYFNSANKHIPTVISYYMIFLFTYAVLSYVKLSPIQSKSSLTAAPPKISVAEWGMHAIAFTFPILYFSTIGYQPFLRMLAMEEYYEASGLRHVYFSELPTITKYLGEYYFRGLMPIWLVFCFAFRPRIFYPLFIVLAWCVLNLITKISFVFMFTPLFLVQCFRRQWLHAIFTALIMAFGMMLVVFATHKSPPPSTTTTASVDFQPSPSRTAAELAHSLYMTTEGIVHRAVMAPGLVTKQWFESFSPQEGVLNGCGYRWIAAIADCQYVSGAKTVWMHNYKNLHDQYNLTGSVTASHYMNGYANFGFIGLIAAALFMAALIQIIQRGFISPAAALIFNLTFIIMTLESQLSTLFNTGGWMVVFLMYWYWLRSANYLSATSRFSPCGQ